MLRRRGLSIVASILLASCTLLTGANELQTIEPVDTGTEAPDGAIEPEPDAAIPIDGGADVFDASLDANGTCISPNLVARWKLDEGSGTFVNDCTENAINGVFFTDGGGVAWVSGKTGTALVLDGGYVGFGDPAKLRLTGAITVTAWVKPAANGPTTTQYFVGKTRNNGTRGWRLGTQDRGDLWMTVSGGDAACGSQGTGALPLDGTWVHVAGVFRPGAAVEAYAAGSRVAIDSSGVPTSINDQGDEVRIGIRGDGTLPFVGAIDDIQIYDRALSATEIQQLATE